MRDLRAYTRQTNLRLIVGGILLILIVGDGLVFLIYGKQAALLGLVCMLAGLSPLLLIWLALAGMEWFTRWSRDRS